MRKKMILTVMLLLLFVQKNGKLLDKSDIVYFGNLKHKTDATNTFRDNLTGGRRKGR